MKYHVNNHYSFSTSEGKSSCLALPDSACTSFGSPTAQDLESGLDKPHSQRLEAGNETTCTMPQSLGNSARGLIVLHFHKGLPQAWLTSQVMELENPRITEVGGEFQDHGIQLLADPHFVTSPNPGGFGEGDSKTSLVF